MVLIPVAVLVLVAFLWVQAALVILTLEGPMLIQLLVVLIILGVVFWAVQKLAPVFGLPAPVVTVIQVLLVVLAVIWLLQVFGLFAGHFAVGR
jgi:hypothetical protein